MSLTAFKRKSIAQFGTKRSGVAPGGVWLNQGPFGLTAAERARGMQSIGAVGPVGFSLNGGHRNVGGVGKDYRMSKSGTPFRGQYPCYTSGGGPKPGSHPVFNVREVDTLGTQYRYIKPSVLSQKGMLERRYKWINNGQYPANWVQPNYTGNQTDTASAGMHTHTLSATYDSVNDVNNPGKYVGFVKNGGPTLCSTTMARFKLNDAARNGPYTKQLYQPLSASQQTLRIQRKCANPSGAIKPFPFAVNAGSSTPMYAAGGVGGNTGVGAMAPPPQYLAPPEWYLKDGCAVNQPA